MTTRHAKPIEGQPLNADQLWAVYQNSKSIKDAGRIFGIDSNKAKKILNDAGLRLRNSDWNEDEIRKLKEAYSSLHGINAEALSIELKRTPDAIYIKAAKMGISSEPGKYKRTAEQTAKTAAAVRLASNDPVRNAKIGSKVSAWISKNGHVKGMLGKKHSEETKQKISAFHKGKKVPREQTIRQLKTMVQKYGRICPNIRRGTWNAGWREIGGKRIYARSKWEANYARYLDFLKNAGSISEWEHEPETFWFDKIKRGVCSYKPDFKVINTNTVEYHEVKGWMDAKSKTKIKRMAKYYPEIKLVVIATPWFKANSKTLSKLIPGWES